MKKLTVMLIVAMLVISLSACNSSGSAADSADGKEIKNTSEDVKVEKGKTIQSEDGKFTAIIPKSWSEMDDLHDDAELQAGSDQYDSYMISLIESKEDLDYSFEEWMDFAKTNTLDTTENDQLSEPENISVNGCPAVQYKLSGTVDNVNIVYLLTYIDGANNYGQIVCWSIKSDYDISEKEFKSIVNSLKGI